MQIGLAVVPLQPRRHRKPRDPGSQTEPGAPSASLYFCETCRTDILSTIPMSTPNYTHHPGYPPTKRNVKAWAKVQVQLEQLKAAPPSEVLPSPPPAAVPLPR